MPLSERETGISNSYLICLGKAFSGVIVIQKIGDFQPGDFQSFTFTETE